MRNWCSEDGLEASAQTSSWWMTTWARLPMHCGRPAGAGLCLHPTIQVTVCHPVLAIKLISVSGLTSAADKPEMLHLEVVLCSLSDFGVHEGGWRSSSRWWHWSKSELTWILLWSIYVYHFFRASCDVLGSQWNCFCTSYPSSLFNSLFGSVTYIAAWWAIL